MKQKTLLEKAMDLKTFHTKISNITEEDIELALAWVNGKVSFSQIQKVKNFPSATSSYIFLSSTLKKYILEKK